MPPCRAALLARRADAANNAALIKPRGAAECVGEGSCAWGREEGEREGGEFGHIRKRRSVRSVWPRKIREMYVLR